MLNAWVESKWTSWAAANGDPKPLKIGKADEPSSAAAGAGALAEDGAADGAVPAAGVRRYAWANKTTRMLLTSCMHIFAKDGSHCGWLKVSEYQERVLQWLNYSVPESSAARQLAAEKADYAAGGGMRSRPDIINSVLADYNAIVEKLKSVKDEPDEQVEHKGAKTSFKFPPAYYQQLKVDCAELMDMMGFGSCTVHALAASIVRDKADDDERHLSWEPSMDWCYWFMHAQLGLVVRNVTGFVCTAEQIAKQDDLHLSNLKTLALAFHDGLPIKYLLGSDQFGLFLFPHAEWKWEKVGAGHATNWRLAAAAVAGPRPSASARPRATRTPAALGKRAPSPRQSIRETTSALAALPLQWGLSVRGGCPCHESTPRRRRSATTAAAGMATVRGATMTARTDSDGWRGWCWCWSCGVGVLCGWESPRVSPVSLEGGNGTVHSRREDGTVRA